MDGHLLIHVFVLLLNGQIFIFWRPLPVIRFYMLKRKLMWHHDCITSLASWLWIQKLNLAAPVRWDLVASIPSNKTKGLPIHVHGTFLSVWVIFEQVNILCFYFVGLYYSFSLKVGTDLLQAKVPVVPVWWTLENSVDDHLQMLTDYIKLHTLLIP